MTSQSLRCIPRAQILSALWKIVSVRSRSVVWLGERDTCSWLFFWTVGFFFSFFFCAFHCPWDVLEQFQSDVAVVLGILKQPVTTKSANWFRQQHGFFLRMGHAFSKRHGLRIEEASRWCSRLERQLYQTGSPWGGGQCALATRKTSGDDLKFSQSNSH